MSSLNLARRLLLSATSQVLPRHDISTSDVSSTRAHTSIDEQDAVNTGADMPLLDIDLDALARDLNALRDELREQMGEEDLKHLKKMVRWGRAASFVGWATSGIIPNPISPLLMSSANFSRWAMIAHHVLHRGYDKVEGTPGHYTSKGFAKGARRILDWMDWIEPEAWVHEHNFQHHYKLGEAHDPDQPELNLEFLRNSKLPMSLRYAVVGFFSITWKYLYYAPNTHGELHYHKLRKKEQGERLDLFNWRLWAPFAAPGWKLWAKSWLPYFVWRFVLLPLPFLLFGPLAWASSLTNMVLTEIFTNFHSFFIIVPNHAGEDLYRFEEPIKDRAEFYLRQIIGSSNYKTGGDLNDFLHGFLNYQIEHHLWPDLSMLAYQKAQPKVKEICERHGVPYTQESALIRFKKLIDVMVGKTSMKSFEEDVKKGLAVIRSKKLSRKPA